MGCQYCAEPKVEHHDPFGCIGLLTDKLGAMTKQRNDLYNKLESTTHDWADDVKRWLKIRDDLWKEIGELRGALARLEKGSDKGICESCGGTGKTALVAAPGVFEEVPCEKCGGLDHVG